MDGYPAYWIEESIFKSIKPLEYRHRHKKWGDFEMEEGIFKSVKPLEYRHIHKKRGDFEMEVFSSTSNILAKSLLNLKAKVSFGILRTS